MRSYCLAIIIAVTSQSPLVAEEKSEFLSPEEVEGEAKGALVTVLDYFAKNDKDLKDLIKERDDLAAKVKRLMGSGDAPKSLEKAKKDLTETKASVLNQQVKLVVGMVPPDQFNKLQNKAKRPPDIRFVIRPQTPEEGAKMDATYCSGLLQFADKDHRAILKRIEDLSAEKARLEKVLKDADDPTDKENLQKKLTENKTMTDSENRAAKESRDKLLRRFVDELNEAKGVPPIKLHSLTDKE